MALSQTPPLYLIDSTFDTLTTSIYRVDPTTGVMTLRAALGTDFTPAFGLAAADQLVLYVTASDTTPANACNGGLACLLLRIVLDPVSSVPTSVQRIGAIRAQGALVTGISGLTFRADGRLYGVSQDNDDLYTINLTTAQATLVGMVAIEVHGGDITFDANDALWEWSNIGDLSGLYQIDPQTAVETPFDIHPNLGFAGMASLGHSNTLYAANPTDDNLYQIDSNFGVTDTNVLLTLSGQTFAHARGDLGSPFCLNDAACNDGNVCTSDTCTPGGCAHGYNIACCGPDPDLDGIGNLCDNCPSVANPGQQDRDADGSGDACDSDDDNDGAADGSDCAPLNPAASVAPVETQGLTLSGASPTHLAWISQGAGFRNDVATGRLGELRSDANFSRASCLKNNLPVSVFDDARAPAPAGDGDYYLIRAQNVCGAGTWGKNSSGTDRSLPNACP